MLLTEKRKRVALFEERGYKEEHYMENYVIAWRTLLKWENTHSFRMDFIWMHCSNLSSISLDILRITTLTIENFNQTQNQKHPYWHNSYER